MAAGHQARRGLFHLAPQALRQGERVAVDLQRHDADQRHADAVDTRRDRERQRRQDVRGVEHPQRQLVAHIGPRHFATDLHLEALAFEGAQFLGQHDRRAVDDRDVADFQSRSFDVRHHATPKQKAPCRPADAGRFRTPLSKLRTVFGPRLKSGEHPPLGAHVQCSISRAKRYTAGIRRIRPRACKMSTPTS
jgi:hypothetical protein